MIELQLGRSERAQALFKNALALNPQFHLVYAGQARERLRQLADSETRTGSASSANVRSSKLGGSLE
jgi:hypothetical protein